MAKKSIYAGSGANDLGAFDLYGNAKQNKNALLSMQQFLNGTNSGAKIKENGLWGAETQGAWDKFNAAPSAVAQTTSAVASQPAIQTTTPAVVAVPYTQDMYTADGAFNQKGIDAFLSNPVSDGAITGQGVGLYNGTLNGKATQFTNDNLHTADAGSITSATLDGTSYSNGKQDQWVNGLSNFEALQGAAGLGSLAMNLYGMLGENGTNAVNKKNMQLMYQQIANNKDIMKTRTERARDIKKYFG